MDNENIKYNIMDNFIGYCLIEASTIIDKNKNNIISGIDFNNKEHLFLLKIFAMTQSVMECNIKIRMNFFKYLIMKLKGKISMKFAFCNCNSTIYNFNHDFFKRPCKAAKINETDLKILIEDILRNYYKNN